MTWKAKKLRVEKCPLDDDILPPSWDAVSSEKVTEERLAKYYTHL
jgi:hypothetical protein